MTSRLTDCGTSGAFPDAPPFPVNLNLSGRQVLVVGAGNVALRKATGLLNSGAALTVVGPQIHPDFHELSRLYDSAAAPGTLELEQRPYRVGEVASYMLAITCTDDAEVNATVHRDGVTSGVWVNSADDPSNCDFTLASVVRQGELQIAISTDGRSPALAMWLRRRFEREFDESWTELLDLLSEVRTELRESIGTSEVSGWLDALDDGLHDLILEGRTIEARARLREHLGLPERAVQSLAAI